MAQLASIFIRFRRNQPNSPTIYDQYYDEEWRKALKQVQVKYIDNSLGASRPETTIFTNLGND